MSDNIKKYVRCKNCDSAFDVSDIENTDLQFYRYSDECKFTCPACGDFVTSKIFNQDDNDPVKTIKKELVVTDELIEAYQNYIALLSKELNDTIPIATIHGWKSNRYKVGKELREKIERLENK
jgi:hypothetical protein